MLISGVIPVHNEDRYLPYSLQALTFARFTNLRELVLVFDRCTDKSIRMVHAFQKRVPFFRFKEIILDERKSKYATSEVFRLGFESASGDVIYSLAADCVYDAGIFNVPWRDLDVASFRFMDYPLLVRDTTQRTLSHWTNLYRLVQTRVMPFVTHTPNISGIYAFRREVLDRVQIEDVPTEDLCFVRQALKKGFRYQYFPEFSNLHLRPAIDNSAKQELHGIGKAHLGDPLLKVIAHTVILGKPHVLKGYLAASRNKEVKAL